MKQLMATQRGANENINRQLPAYLPKRSDISNLIQKELGNIALESNNKPRKDSSGIHHLKSILGLRKTRTSR